jgi:hypothetical protein
MLDYFFFIRYSGESSIGLCLDSIKPLNGGFFTSVTFSSTLHESLIEMCNIASSIDNDWIIAVDADVILDTNFIDKVENMVNHCTENIENSQKILVIQGLLACNIWKNWRHVGLHIYNRKNLLMARDYLDLSRDLIRPESGWWAYCRNHSFITVHTKIKLGYHQFYRTPHEALKQGIFQSRKYRSSVVHLLNLNHNDLAFIQGVVCGISGLRYQDLSFLKNELNNSNFSINFATDVAEIKEYTLNWPIEVKAGIILPQTKITNFKLKILRLIVNFIQKIIIFLNAVRFRIKHLSYTKINLIG